MWLVVKRESCSDWSVAVAVIFDPSDTPGFKPFTSLHVINFIYLGRRLMELCCYYWRFSSLMCLRYIEFPSQHFICFFSSELWSLYCFWKQTHWHHCWPGVSRRQRYWLECQDNVFHHRFGLWHKSHYLRERFSLLGMLSIYVKRIEIDQECVLNFPWYSINKVKNYL